MAQIWTLEAKDKLIQMWKDRPSLYEVNTKAFSNRLDRSMATHEHLVSWRNENSLTHAV